MLSLLHEVKHLVIAICVLFNLHRAARASSTTPINQTLALKHLYDTTNGPGWIFYNEDAKWNFSEPLEFTDPCLGWEGVRCLCITMNETRRCNIVTLTVFWAHMKGSIPSTLGMLEHLVLLNLAFNYLTGEIPTSLFSLTALRRLDLGYNSLTGSIPPEATEIRGLTHFNVFYNLLSGSIPEGIDNWAILQVSLLLLGMAIEKSFTTIYNDSN